MLVVINRTPPLIIIDDAFITKHKWFLTNTNSISTFLIPFYVSVVDVSDVDLSLSAHPVGLCNDVTICFLVGVIGFAKSWPCICQLVISKLKLIQPTDLIDAGASHLFAPHCTVFNDASHLFAHHYHNNFTVFSQLLMYFSDFIEVF